MTEVKSNVHYAVRTGKSSLTQKYLGQVYKDNELVWQSRIRFDTREEAHAVANAACVELMDKPLSQPRD